MFMWSTWLVMSMFLFWFSGRIIYPSQKVGCWSTHLLLSLLYFSFQFCKYFLYIFMCSIFGCIYIYNCYFLLKKLSFYHDTMSSFASCDSFLFQIHFLWCKYDYSCSFLVIICMEYLFPLFYFYRVCVCLFFVFQYWGLNSVPTFSVTPSALFGDELF
jgi:hypothetical protein